MVERVVRYKEKEPLLERYGVDAEIRSTLSRRVDLPSGGYLVFDYAEAFTVIDVNTGRFVGSRSKTSASRLEDTITKNNLEAVKEVVRQLRLRDIGGIIVIDFIDMANPKNRQAVEDALRTELERDRTKTYVVEISPLGLVEMTRQNVTEGPREILTRKCPTCGGDGVVISEQSAAIDLERRLRALARGSRVQAFRVEVNARVASLLIGSGRVAPPGDRGGVAQALLPRRRRRTSTSTTSSCSSRASSRRSRRRRRSRRARRSSCSRSRSACTIRRRPSRSSTATTSSSPARRELVGKKVKAQVARVLPGTAYATIVSAAKDGAAPITAEGEAEKPTRKPDGEEGRAARRAGARPRVAAERRRSRPKTTTRGRRVEAGAEARAEEEDAARLARRAQRRKKTPTIHVPGGRARARTATSRRRQPRRLASRARAGAAEAEPSAVAEAAEPRSPRTAAPTAAADGDARRSEDAPRLARRPEPAQEAGRPRGSRRNDATAARIPAPRAPARVSNVMAQLRDHQPRREAVRRQGRRAPARGPPRPRRGQDVPAGRPVPRRRRRRRARAEGLGDRQGRRPRARPEGADRQVQAEVGLQAAHGLPLVAHADRDHRHRRAQGGREGEAREGREATAGSATTEGGAGARALRRACRRTTPR